MNNIDYQDQSSIISKFYPMAKITNAVYFFLMGNELMSSSFSVPLSHNHSSIQCIVQNHGWDLELIKATDVSQRLRGGKR